MIKLEIDTKRDSFHLLAKLSLPAEGITCLFGPSGSGKTTILRTIAGLDKHQLVNLSIGDTIWQDQQTFIPPHQRATGYVFQDANLFPHLNVLENIEYGFKRIPPALRHISIQQAVDLLDLQPLLTRKPAQLSGGEKQRTAIARAIAVSPKILLMDEPLASLDEQRKQEILPYIESLNKELSMPVIYVSHSSAEVARLADQLVLLEAGKVLGAGPISEMLTRADLSLAHRSDAEALISAQVVSHDQEYNLSHLDFSGGRFTVVGTDLKIGSNVRLRIAAQDVSLTLQAQSDTSILNIFPAKISSIIAESESQMTVHLSMGNVQLLARLTRKSVTSLNLEEGKQVFAQIKSVAVLS